MTNKELMTRLTMLEREVALLRCRVEKNEVEISPMGKINDDADVDVDQPSGRQLLSKP